MFAMALTLLRAPLTLRNTLTKMVSTAEQFCSYHAVQHHLECRTTNLTEDRRPERTVTGLEECKENLRRIAIPTYGQRR